MKLRQACPTVGEVIISVSKIEILSNAKTFIRLAAKT